MQISAVRQRDSYILARTLCHLQTLGMPRSNEWSSWDGYLRGGQSDRRIGRFGLTCRPPHNVVCLLIHMLILKPPGTTYAVILLQRDCEILVDLDRDAAPRGVVLRAHTWLSTYSVCSSASSGFDQSVYVKVA